MMVLESNKLLYLIKYHIRPKPGVEQIVEHDLWKIHVMITLVLNPLSLPSRLFNFYDQN